MGAPTPTFGSIVAITHLPLVFLLFYLFFFRTTQFLVKIALQINNFSRVSIISNITIIISNVMRTRRSVVT